MRPLLRPLPLLVLIFLAGALATRGQAKPSRPTTGYVAPDYANPANWVCRPGAETTCTANLDAEVVFPGHPSKTVRFQPAADPPIDCFYAYPTVSLQETEYASMTASPEVRKTVNAQAGLLTTRCRVYAPLYRQVTVPALRRTMANHGQISWELPERDLLAAWAFYLQHDNHGRGVVLIGHSQGTILLQELMAAAVDGKPAQALLVSAFLAGDPSLGVPPGARVGGTFKHIPTCDSAAETGCVYVWGSYRADAPATDQIFGAARKDGLVSACENPAAPAGGSGALKWFIHRPSDQQNGKTPWVEVLGVLTGECRNFSGRNAFRVTVLKGPYAKTANKMLDHAARQQRWGLHALDLTLVKGNILDVLDAETASWAKTHPAPKPAALPVATKAP